MRLFSRGAVMALAAAAMAWSGCVTYPVHNQVIPTRSTPITFRAWLAVKNKPVQIQCRPFFTGVSWTPIKTVNSAGSPTVRPSQGDLYLANTTFVVPESCWYGWHSQYTTELRFLGGPYFSGGGISPLSVYDEEGRTCLYEEVGKGTDYVTAQSECRLKTTSGNDSTLLYVHAEE